MRKFLRIILCFWSILLTPLGQVSGYANTVGETSFLTLNCNKTKDATNKTSNDGEVEINLSLVVGIANFSLRNSSGAEISAFMLSGPTINTSIADLVADNYTIQVTDASSTSTCTFTIGVVNCDLVAQVPNTTVNCVGDLGNLNSIVSGGLPPYQYKWSTGAVSAHLTNVSPSSYSLTVTDKVGCESITTGTIVAPTVLQASTIVTNATDISTNNGQVTLTGIGGTPDYMLEIVNPSGLTTFSGNIPVGDISISDLMAGLYTIKLADKNNCVFTGSFRIGVVNCSLDAVLNDVNLNCASDLTDLTVQVSGNLNPVNYSWQGGQTTQTITNVGPGTYTVSVTDATGSGCQVVKTAVITSTSSPIITSFAIMQLATDYSAMDGIINLSISGGNSPYALTVKNSTGTAIIDNLQMVAMNTQINLPPGVFTYSITDNNNCIVNGNFLVGVQNCLIQANVNDVTSSCDGSDANLTATTIQMVSPVTYLWSNNETTPTITNLTSGTYSVTTTDAVGCESITSGVMTRLSNPVLTCKVTEQPANLEATGTVNFTFSGTAPPFLFNLSGNSQNQMINFNQASAISLDLPTGTYQAILTDQTGCQASCNITVQAIIPTLSQWGTLLFGLLIINLGVFFLWRMEMK